MATKPLDDEVLSEAVASLRKHGSVAAACRALDIPRSTLDHRLRLAKARRISEPTPKSPALELPQFEEPGDIEVSEILDVMERRFDKRVAAKNEKKWYKVKAHSNEPIAVHFVGDPHCDSPGANISLLRRDLSLMSQPGNYGCNCGDSTDGAWPGRLARLHANSDTSLETARRLAEWLLNDTVDWLCWVMGNHDLWGADADLLRARNTHKVPMADWAARWQIVFPNGRACRIISAHDFPGRSIWNSLHSNQRAAITTDKAHIFASGHTHHWAMHQEENEHREFVYWLIRARGYKYIDEYGERLGHPGQQHGATISAIIDPEATSDVGFVQCFADVAEATEYLAWKRSR